MKLVKELIVGDECIVKNHGQECLVIVRKVLNNRVLVSKPFGSAMFGISFMNPHYSDLLNRVQDI